MPVMADPNLLVGTETGDDAGVYRIGDDKALVLTVDFFPPIVDDPFSYGAIAVANSLSDVYAMGGRPILGLNIVGFPVDQPKEILGDILKGGYTKAQEAGCLIVGGHTVDDAEPKYGLAVVGLVEPGSQITNAGAKPGDALVLTKPIGTGIITTAGKQGVADEQTVSRAVAVMSALNRAASETMVKVGVNACTDVTGFGLIGHLDSMMRGSGATAVLEASAVPVILGTRELLEQGIAPGGTHRNLDSMEGKIRWDDATSDAEKLLLCDAQTSGGLLISLPAAKSDQLLQELNAAGVNDTAVIGRVIAKGTGPETIHVVP